MFFSFGAEKMISRLVGQVRINQRTPDKLAMYLCCCKYGDGGVVVVS